MGFGSDILKEYDKIQGGLERDLEASALNLYGDLVKSTPVGDPSTWAINQGRKDGKIYRPPGYSPGELRTSWQLPKKIGRFTWVITNIAPHAVIIDGGRRPIPTKDGVKEVGSKQLPKGFNPIIKKTKDALQRKLK